MLTIGQLKQIIERNKLSDDTQLCIPYDPTQTSSVCIEVNVVNVTLAENSYGKSNRITLITSPEYPSKDLTVRTLVAKNTWKEEVI